MLTPTQERWAEALQVEKMVMDASKIFEDIRRVMADYKRPLYDRLDLGGPAIRMLPDPQPSAPYGNPYGIPIRESRMFPYQYSCSKCSGTGDGRDESTYCQSCRGAGEIRIEGVMSGQSNMAVITSPLPAKFPIAWPAVAVAKRPSAGIVSAPWPA